MYKRIGIDIDNTITKIELALNELAQFYNKPVPSVDMILDYNLSSVYGISERQSLDFWNSKEEFIIRKSEVDTQRLKNMLDTFTDDNTEVYIITARDLNYYEATYRWLVENDIQFEKLITTSNETKVGFLDKHNIELMIDDKPSLFYEVEESRISTKMVCVDYPYNQGVPCYMRLNRSGEILEYAR